MTTHQEGPMETQQEGPVEICVGDEVETEELVDLYDAVGWSTYTADPEALARAVANSSFVVTSRDGGALVGLARGLSDDVAVCYLQDVLVRPSHQRRGIGRALLEASLEHHAHVRQKVLLTDDDPAQHALYRSVGFRRTSDLEATPMNAYVRFET